MECIVGCNTHTINSPPRIGSFLTVKHSGHYKSGVLRHPFFWRRKSENISLQSSLLPSNRSLVVDLLLFLIIQEPNAYWIHWQHRRQFFDCLAENMGYKAMNDLYGITANTISYRGGTALYHNFYNSSLLEALEEVYPAHKWYPWKLNQTVEPGYWNIKENQRNFLEWLTTENGLSLDKLTTKNIKDSGGASLLEKYGGSAAKVVNSVFTERL
jgi:hypothetical protein